MEYVAAINDLMMRFELFSHETTGMNIHFLLVLKFPVQSEALLHYIVARIVATV
jgi:hypothetical protein